MTASSVVVVNSDRTDVIAWQVLIQPEPTPTRLVGAWVCGYVPYAPNHALLVVHEMIRPSQAQDHALFDPVGAQRSVARERDRLDALHRESPTKTGGARAPIRWPRVPDSLDFYALPVNPPGVVQTPPIAETVAIARWVQDLGDAWAGIETIRLSREHLRGGEPSRRPLPGISY